MLPFQQGSELSSKSIDLIGDQIESNLEDQIYLLEGNAQGSVGSMNLNLRNNRGRGRGKGRGRGRKAPFSADTIVNSVCPGNNCDDHDTKKVFHRDLERQRRQEMSNLFTSLRSILPAEYIKGKRATSDHIGEAANYIKDLEKNLKGLAEKRDHLRESTGGSSHETSRSSNSAPGRVEILQRPGGLDIEINVGCDDELFSVSSALKVVLEEGLEIVSCSSTRVDDRLLHSILCEMRIDAACIDIYRLQRKLGDHVR